jgi:hypothetical protein
MTTLTLTNDNRMEVAAIARHDGTFHDSIYILYYTIL